MHNSVACFCSSLCFVAKYTNAPATAVIPITANPVGLVKPFNTFASVFTDVFEDSAPVFITPIACESNPIPFTAFPAPVVNVPNIFISGPAAATISPILNTFSFSESDNFWKPFSISFALSNTFFAIGTNPFVSSPTNSFVSATN